MFTNDYDRILSNMLKIEIGRDFGHYYAKVYNNYDPVKWYYTPVYEGEDCTTKREAEQDGYRKARQLARQILKKGDHICWWVLRTTGGSPSCGVTYTFAFKNEQAAQDYVAAFEKEREECECEEGHEGYWHHCDIIKGYVWDYQEGESW